MDRDIAILKACQYLVKVAERDHGYRIPDERVDGFYDITIRYIPYHEVLKTGCSISVLSVWELDND